MRATILQEKIALFRSRTIPRFLKDLNDLKDAIDAYAVGERDAKVEWKGDEDGERGRHE